MSKRARKWCVFWAVVLIPLCAFVAGAWSISPDTTLVVLRAVAVLVCALGWVVTALKVFVEAYQEPK